jgi:hypothetical protein
MFVEFELTTRELLFDESVQPLNVALINTNPAITLVTIFILIPLTSNGSPTKKG